MARIWRRIDRRTLCDWRPDPAAIARAKRIAGAFGVLSLLTVDILVPEFSRVGPILFAVGSVGLHALDVAVLTISVPLVVALLRYVDEGG